LWYGLYLQDEVILEKKKGPVGDKMKIYQVVIFVTSGVGPSINLN
jgi:hypothetical protein